MFNECTQRYSAPCALSYKTSILNKRSYITLPHKYSFLLAFFLSPPTSGKTSPLTLVSFLSNTRKFPALNQELHQEHLVNPSKGSQNEEQRENSSAWSCTNEGKTPPTTLCPRIRSSFLDPLQNFGVQRGQSVAEALT